MLVLMVPIVFVLASAMFAGEYFQIRIVDQQTGRGVPMVQLRTNNHFSCYTDSNGIVAWNEPGLMDRKVFFAIESPGYRFAGGGTTVHTSPGGKVELKVQRLNIAERLYRVTGEGVCRAAFSPASQHRRGTRSSTVGLQGKTRFA